MAQVVECLAYHCVQIPVLKEKQNETKHTEKTKASMGTELLRTKTYHEGFASVGWSRTANGWAREEVLTQTQAPVEIWSLQKVVSQTTGRCRVRCSAYEETLSLLFVSLSGLGNLLQDGSFSSYLLS
jgi:hypothetical protein